MTAQNLFGNLALDATLAALSAKLPAQAGGMLPVNADGSAISIIGTVPVSLASWPGLTDAQIRAAPVAVVGQFFQSVQPVSATELPLPAGAATEATLAALNTKAPALVGGKVPVDLASGTVAVSNLPATQAVSAAALPLPTGAATEATLAALNAKVSTTPSGALLAGTARDRFFDNFNTFDTVDTWEVVTTGPGMAITGPLGGAVAGSTPYLNIASGTTSGSEVVILSRSTFSAPVDLRYQISASQRIANNRLIIGFVEVNDTGAVVTSTNYATAPEILDARNAVFHQHDETTATTAQLRARAAGSALDTFANAFGTGFTTVATGTGPNWISATTYALSFERDKINSRAIGSNVTTNTGGQFSYDRVIPNPTKQYKLCIIVENNAAPATSTDWRIHLINVMDATRFDVSPRNGGTADGAKAFPMWVTGGAMSVTATLASTTVNPIAPATPYILNSLATTNIALILTGTSGLQAFYATNTGAAAAYVKLYNKATAPVLASDIPAMLLVVPAAVGGVPGVCTLPIGFSGFRFALGLGIAITGGAADADATAVAAGQVKVILSRTV